MNPEEAAPAAWVVIAIEGVLAFVFLWTFDKAFRTLFAPLLNRVAGIELNAKFVHWAPFGFLHNIVVDVEEWTRSGMAASERAIVYGFGSLLWMGYDLAFTIAKTAYDFNTAIDNLWAHVTHGTTKVIHETVVKPLTKSVRYVDAKLTARVHTLEGRVGTLSAQVSHIAHATAGTIAAPFPRIGSLERKVNAQSKRLSRVEKLLAGGVGVALLVRAMSKLGLGWLRCNNVGKAGKAVCKMNPLALEALLLDAAALTVTFNLEEFARELQTVSGEAARLIHKFAD